MVEALLREKVVEALVLVEHLPLFATPEGLEMFGGLCEMLGRCCRHLGAGRRDQALRIAMTVSRSIPHALPLGRDRDALEHALEEVVAVLEMPPDDRFH